MADIVKMFYDTETTGLNYKNCSIHQLSCIIEVNDIVVEKLDLKLKPHEKAVFEDGALETHGITIDEMMSYPDYKVSFNIFKNTLRKYSDRYDKNRKIFIIGFKNASFDDAFLKMLFTLCNDEFYFYFYASTIDVSCLAAEYLIKRRAKMPSFKLLRVAKELGLYVDDSKTHDGVYDCELTRQIYRIVTGREEEGLI